LILTNKFILNQYFRWHLYNYQSAVAGFKQSGSSLKRNGMMNLWLTLISPHGNMY
jgi:hypothetical protein